ncbi:uncharacterized protein LOC143448616 [Clavelina lepadiformis]|uniref:Protein kinase domain-containing protein n=1 Tax=Clavelina lepadiformis TaxID=159417 RepID=A0ABP0GI32_CLALP
MSKNDLNFLGKKKPTFPAENIFCNEKGNVLGSGGFATVWVGYHEQHGKLAVKCIDLKGSAQAMRKMKDDILAEAGAMALAKHKHIIDIKGVTKGVTWVGIVMEFMSAGSLQDLIDNEKIKILPQLLTRMSYEMADGITYLHNRDEKRRIIHGDLKPANILLGPHLHCKIADFGGAVFSLHTVLAKNQPSNEVVEQFTLMFGAPEVNSNTRPSKAMDVYSFGVILLIAMAGCYPEDEFDTSPNELLQHLSQSKDTNERNLTEDERRETRDISSMLEGIVTKCLDKHPDIRPPITAIRSQLYEILHKLVDPSTLAKQVADLLHDIPLNKDTLDKKNHTSLAKLKESKGSLANCDESSSGVTGYRDFKKTTTLIKKAIASNLAEKVSRKCEELVTFLNKESLTDDELLKAENDVTGLISIIEKNISMASVKLLHGVAEICRIWPKPEGLVKLINKWLDVANNFICLIDENDDTLPKTIGQVLLYANDFLDDLSSVKENISVLKAKATSWKSIATCHRRMANPERELHFNKKAVTALEDKWNDSMKLVGCLYSALCNNLGTNYYDNDQFDLAESFFVKAYYANQDAEDYETKDKKMKNLRLIIENICLLHVKTQNRSKKSTSEIYHHLSENQKTSSTTLNDLMIHLMILRLALLLQLPNDDVKILCDKVNKYHEDCTPDSHNLTWLCNVCHKIAQSLLESNHEEQAAKILQCLLKFTPFLTDPDKKLSQIYNVSELINKKDLQHFLKQEKRDETPNIFPPICHKIIKQIEECDGGDEKRKTICLSSALCHASWSYLKAKDYKACLDAASKALNTYKSCGGGNEPDVNSIKAKVKFCVGICYYQMKNFDSAKSELQEMIDLCRDDEKKKNNVNVAQAYLDEMERSPDT